ncbi:unnamed protein product [Arctogadus glacialis]
MIFKTDGFFSKQQEADVVFLEEATSPNPVLGPGTDAFSRFNNYVLIFHGPGSSMGKDLCQLDTVKICSDLDHISCEEDVLYWVKEQIDCSKTFDICVARDAMVAGIEKRLFEGESEKGKVPKYSRNDLDNELFKVAGEIFGVSIAQRGPAPRFMQEWCYHYLVTGNLKTDSVHDTELSPLIKTMHLTCPSTLKKYWIVATLVSLTIRKAY